MMSLFPWTRAYRAKKLAQESDFGRRYGWFIERKGDRIGELEYIRWDSLGQFWHEYSVVWHSEAESCIETDPDAWMQRNVTLRSRRYPDIVIVEFLTAPRTKGVIAVRFASVPVERFEKEDTV